MHVHTQGTSPLGCHETPIMLGSRCPSMYIIVHCNVLIHDEVCQDLCFNGKSQYIHTDGVIGLKTNFISGRLTSLMSGI